jgi:hypothetical protein
LQPPAVRFDIEAFQPIRGNVPCEPELRCFGELGVCRERFSQPLHHPPHDLADAGL